MTLFGLLKRSYDRVCQDLTANYPGVVISRANVCGLFKKAWNETITSSDITAGFEACGIFPLNPAAVPREAYKPNSLYTINELLQNPDLAGQNLLQVILSH